MEAVAACLKNFMGLALAHFQKYWLLRSYKSVSHSFSCNDCKQYFQIWIKLILIFQVFDELLLDADWSVNAGTWMWLSCSSFFTQFFPIYDPVKFGRKVDPNGDYIR